MAIRHAIFEARGAIERAVPVVFFPCAVTTGAMFSGLARRVSDEGFRCW